MIGICVFGINGHHNRSTIKLTPRVKLVERVTRRGRLSQGPGSLILADSSSTGQNKHHEEETAKTHRTQTQEPQAYHRRKPPEENSPDMLRCYPVAARPGTEWAIAPRLGPRATWVRVPNKGTPRCSTSAPCRAGASWVHVPKERDAQVRALAHHVEQRRLHSCHQPLL